MRQKSKQNLILAIALLVFGGGLILGGKFLLNQRGISTDSNLKANVYELTPEGRKLVKTFTLTEGAEDTFEFHGKLGITVVEIDGLRARVKSSPCPDQVCVQFGWLSLNSDFSACLPNSMMVVIEDNHNIGY
ncbi:MAG: NusG domain II-containing protein [Firmicutes bacterium]|nr:NusG domain II-containing protein [Bacillota bacterium]